MSRYLLRAARWLYWLLRYNPGFRRSALQVLLTVIAFVVLLIVYPR